MPPFVQRFKRARLFRFLSPGPEKKKKIAHPLSFNSHQGPIRGIILIRLDKYMTANEPDIKTFPLPELLDNLAHEINRVLVIRSGPLSLVSRVIETLQLWKPHVSITQYCHAGEEISLCENIIYPHPGYFRFELADLESLCSRKFDLAVIPYATNRRLHPDYHELDRITSGLGARAVMAYYWDGTALVLNSQILEYKVKQIVKPYVERKRSAIEELSAFTGEGPCTVEDNCNRGAQLGNELWLRRKPQTDKEIHSFYQESDFYIYALMKECDWRGARADLAEPIREEIKPGGKVLDYGGGCGTLAIDLARAGFECSHLDLPGKLLDFASFRFARRGMDIKVIPAFEKYPLKEHYDAIICTHVIEHLPNPEEKIHHMADHIQAGGKLFLAIPFKPNPVAGVPPGMHLNRLSEERYRDLVAELGLEQVRKIDNLDIFQKAG